MAAVSPHPSLCPSTPLHGAAQHTENPSLLTWVMAGCRATWPNEGQLPMSVPRWGPMAELQTSLQEMGMRHAIYDDDFLGPEAMTFTTGMSDHILQAALAAYAGPRFPSFQVWWETVQPAAR